MERGDLLKDMSAQPVGRVRCGGGRCLWRGALRKTWHPSALHLISPGAKVPLACATSCPPTTNAAAALLHRDRAECSRARDRSTRPPTRRR